MGKSRQRALRPPSPISPADALFTKSQQRVLAVLFGNPNRSYYASEIIAAAKSGTGAVQRELARLEAAQLVTTRRIGNQKHYQANPDAAVFGELRGLVLKTAGLADQLQSALAPMNDSIRAAFVFGSVAKGGDTATSDIDLMIISDSLTHADVFRAVDLASSRLGRRVNPTVYSTGEWIRRVRAKSAFVARVGAQTKIWIIGGESDLPA
jgi:predicted nucleotidyltransferase